MESKQIVINNYYIECYRINTLIIGSGAASLNAAVSLHSMGQEDLLIATSKWGGGTSNNAGSDKQTYYKLSLCGNEPDSVFDMAQDLFNGKCMHGDIALCEAQGSVQAFMKLVSLGVRFPHDKYGSWVGYKTDHDRRARATSVGPYTSRKMFEALASEVKKKGINVLDQHHCIALITDPDGLKVSGAIAINTKETDPLKAFVLFNSTNVILGSGGPAGIYETSVYPLSQSGSIGMAFKAGATGQNLTESQFGIASVKFRWNLSGSYQQAIPRYFSRDKSGKNEKEFLKEEFPDVSTLAKAIFLKGYQWPFDPRKVSNYGSSLIDILVHREIEKGRDVFIDYLKNPTGKSDSIFDLENLDPEVINYLKKSGAVKSTPIRRLLAINPLAVSLYKGHGIDLEKEPLQIAVCAQHNNGGLKADIWWESDLRHLFPVGEVNGSHGVYRPGGSALNSGQVGSYRAAQYISKKYTMPPLEEELFLESAAGTINEILTLSAKWTNRGNSNKNELYLSEIRKRMSAAGGIIREKENVSVSKEDAFRLLKELPDNLGAGSVNELADSFQLLDLCITHYVYLESINSYIAKGGRSRGSYLVQNSIDTFGTAGSYKDHGPDLCKYDRDVEKKIQEAGFKKGGVAINLEDVREVPVQDLWFERVWKEYLEDNYPES